MSTAQAIASASVPSASPPRAAASASDRADSSFEDTLDTAARGQDAPEAPDGRSAPREVSKKTSKNARDGNDSEDRGDAASEATASPRVASTALADLSAMLAQLKGGSGDAAARCVSDDTQSVTDVSAALQQPTMPSGDNDVVLPGQVSEAADALDADALLALLNGAKRPGELQDQRETLDIKVKVAGQETHLAISAPLPPPVPSEDGQPASPVAGLETQTAEQPPLPAAVIAQAAEDAAPMQRARGVQNDSGVAEKSDRQGGAAKTDAEPSRTASSIFAEHSVAARDEQQAKQQDNRGSSNSNSQQNSPIFANVTAGSIQAVAAAGGDDTSGVFAPVSDQIAAEVSAELKPSVTSEGSGDGVVKVLSIELKPANLGSVTVRLALKDNAIAVHIEAQHRDTLAVIERERDALVNALASAGYSVDTVTSAPMMETRQQSSINGIGDAGAFSSQGQPGQASQGFTNSSGGDGRSQQGGSGLSGHRPTSDDKDVGNPGVRSGGGSLYV